MEHTNLFLYENDAALEVDYPNGKVDDVIPGVAYARTTGDDDPTVIYNDKKTRYAVTLNLKDRSGVTISTAVTIQTPETIEGASAKVNIFAPEVDNYKPITLVEKIEVSGDSSHDVLYYAATSYTVTVHHLYNGSAITADTSIVVDGLYETEKKKVTIMPENVGGYEANPVVITVSGDMEYNYEYSFVICYVDMGLPSGALWACNNLGANSELEVGNVYEWGELVPRTSWNEWEDYRFFDTQTSSMTKYNATDEITSLEPEDDVVTAEIGPDWHMPTLDNWYELVENSTITNSNLDTETGTYYVRFVSNINGNELIFPQYQIEYGNSNNGNEAIMWTSQNGLSTDYGIEKAYMVGLLCEGYLCLHGVNRCATCPVRPVKSNIEEI